MDEIVHDEEDEGCKIMHVAKKQKSNDKTGKSTGGAKSGNGGGKNNEKGGGSKRKKRVWVTNLEVEVERTTDQKVVLHNMHR
ncbi:hypothetical protein PHMEG_00020749 [Phytophthora megakarya]|uniref:Uncharacterized protein n=1 Tax=Phytophthora megakarya TaxID=4795 RepID=A0A225VQW3_9STRA|nr:hypothetical protein PHMEG_00020749 [Phytophthora megakarya]